MAVRGAGGASADGQARPRPAATGQPVGGNAPQPAAGIGQRTARMAVGNPARLVDAMEARDFAAALRLLEESSALATQRGLPVSPLDLLVNVEGPSDADRLRLLDKLLACGASGEHLVDNTTPLVTALQQFPGMQPQATDLILARGADSALRRVDMLNPLFAAISQNCWPAVERLLRGGARPDARVPGGATPLHAAMAVACTHAPGPAGCIVEALVRHTRDPNRQEADGDTPLHLAARAGNAHAISVLLRHRAINPERYNLAGLRADEVGTALVCAPIRSRVMERRLDVLRAAGLQHIPRLVLTEELWSLVRLELTT